MSTLLDIRNLKVCFGSFTAIEDFSLRLEKGGRLGLVGESGSGKSTLGLAILGLLPETAKYEGTVNFSGSPLPWHKDHAMTKIRGAQIGFVHQDPMSAFSPVHTIGKHLTRAYKAAHPNCSKHEAKSAAIALLEEVEITKAAERLNHYPHEYSGGMLQRVMIAASLVGNPALLIADEPTTALDVTTQAAVLRVMDRVVETRGMSLILITHDLGVVAEACTEVAVMYRGQLLQHSAINRLHDAAHPYTKALLKARPHNGIRSGRLPTITDMLPEGWADA